MATFIFSDYIFLCGLKCWSRYLLLKHVTQMNAIKIIMDCLLCRFAFSMEKQHVGWVRLEMEPRYLAW